MKKRSKVGTAWAIDLPYSDHVSWPLAGVFWFCGSSPEPWHDGCRTALFRTRAAARAHMASTCKRGRIVKVTMLISEAV